MFMTFIASKSSQRRTHKTVDSIKTHLIYFTPHPIKICKFQLPSITFNFKVLLILKIHHHEN